MDAVLRICTKKLCPLLAIANHVGSHGFPEVDCQGERCAWWNAHDEECTLLSLTLWARDISRAIEAHGGR